MLVVAIAVLKLNERRWAGLLWVKKRHAGVSARCPFLPIADIGCGAWEMAARGTVGTGNAAPRGRPAALAMVSERPANENHIPLEVERIRILREFARNRFLKEFFRNHESAEAGLAESIMGQPFRRSGLLAPQEPGYVQQ
jgi:hypothetical protein